MQSSFIFRIADIYSTCHRQQSRPQKILLRSLQPSVSNFSLIIWSSWKSFRRADFQLRPNNTFESMRHVYPLILVRMDRMDRRVNVCTGKFVSSDCYQLNDVFRLRFAAGTIIFWRWKTESRTFESRSNKGRWWEPAEISLHNSDLDDPDTDFLPCGKYIYRSNLSDSTTIPLFYAAILKKESVVPVRRLILIRHFSLDEANTVASKVLRESQ